MASIFCISLLYLKYLSICSNNKALSRGFNAVNIQCVDYEHVVYQNKKLKKVCKNTMLFLELDPNTKQTSS